MTGRFSKRGKNPAAVDSWLDSLGYYRKNVAYDETCLFRAVSEQLFSTQINHEDVRKRCIWYGQQNWKDFQYLVPRKKDWLDRLKKLAVHMIFCTDIEIQLVSCAYQVDITVFNAVSHETRDFRGHKLYKGTQTLLLCKTGEDHYDAVYTIEHIATAGLCQSIVYNILYEKVFEVPDVELVVHRMLHDKQAPYTVYCPEGQVIKKESPEDEEVINDELVLELPARQRHMLAPFPFKIAKALDSSMYRNIEYDTWLELRREMRLGEWYYGDEKLILGTRCILTSDDQDFQCYIQEILESHTGKCEVYIIQLAERRTVNYSDLRPENDAKPWPLPYRFARNQSLPLANSIAPDNERKTLRKRREKKRLQLLSEESTEVEKQDTVSDINVSNYEGYPLHMQDAADVKSLECLSTVIKLSSCSPEPSNDQNEAVCVMSESMAWDQSPAASEEVYYNTMMQPSDSVPYQDHNDEQAMYSYSPEATYPPMSMWSPQPQYMLSPDSAFSGDDTPSPVDNNGNSQKYVYYQTDSAYCSPSYPPQSPAPLSFAPFPASFADRVMCSAPASPANSQVDSVYPIMCSVPSPGTPVYYPHPPPAQTSRPDFMIPTAPPMPICSPPMLEVQYVCSPCVYPSTPSMAWYNHSHPHVNAQGFVFPTPLNNNQNAAQNLNVPNRI